MGARKGTTAVLLLVGAIAAGCSGGSSDSGGAGAPETTGGGGTGDVVDAGSVAPDGEAAPDTATSDAADSTGAGDGQGDGSDVAGTPVDATDGTDTPPPPEDTPPPPEDTTSAGPCAPGEGCTVPVKECLGLVDNTGLTRFGLRVSELALTKPDALSKGIPGKVVAGGAAPSLPMCGVTGDGTLSWLLELDTAASTVKTGGAKPVANPAEGYTFVDEVVPADPVALNVQPVTFMGVKPGGDGAFSITDGLDLILPVYLDAAASQVVLLPIHELRFLNATLSANQSCIGHYNAEGLSPDESCLPDSDHPAFVTGAAFDGFISLEEADNVVIPVLAETLCVLLSDDAATYGDGSQPIAKCKRDMNGAILVKGDWCSATNQAAADSCADAFAFGGTFAASSVLITP